MRAGNRLLGVLVAICALALALATPGGAVASGRQEMILQDDQELIYSDAQHVTNVLKALAAMGVDRVRVSVVWSLVAPKPNSSKRPKFKATDPGAYPAGVWTRWDFLDRTARQHGVKVYFQPTAPAPNWATTPRRLPQGYRWGHDINPTYYGQFVQAVGKRYNGTYKPPGSPSALPAVTYWGIYNEPNIGGWMTPQWNTTKGGKKVEASPAMYRAMADAAWTGLVRTGHRHNTVLIGETAAYGAGHKGYGASMDPLTFVRAFYCVGRSYRPLKGQAATRIGCPASGSRGGFVRAHPGLFNATGWAHHPYDFTNPPDFVRKDPNSAALSSMSRIEKALDRSRKAYHQRAGQPVYITEWGVQSKNPSPYIKFTQAQQAEFINEGEYMAWLDRRVPSFAQFLLVDAGPNTHYNANQRQYWGTFQSGLLSWPYDRPKPAFAAFELPLWVPNPAHGGSVEVWGHIRPKQPRTAALEFQAAGSSAWTTLTDVTATDTEGFFTTHVSLPSAGSLRLDWTGSVLGEMFSRSVPIS
jgi:hypothetical protein